MKSLKGYFFIAGASLFWGVSATVTKFLFSRNVDVVILTQTRLTFPFLLMAPVQMAGALIVILTVVVLQNKHDPLAELQP